MMMTRHNINYEITDREMKDYIYCPVYYDFKYNNKSLKIDKPPTTNELLAKIVHTFCIGLMDGEVMDENTLKRKWSSLCRNNSDVMTSEKIAEGFSAIMKFYRWAEDNRINVIDAVSRYKIKFFVNDNSIDLTGSIGVILLNDYKQFEELVVDFSKAKPDQSDLDKNLDISMSHVGFYYSMPKSERISLIGTRIYHVKTNTEYYTTRDPQSEAKKVAKIAYNIAKGIRNNIYYPTQSPFCKKWCPVNNFCAMWGTAAVEDDN